jgi:hypothetical protein
MGRLQKFKLKKWIVSDITEDGYRLILARIADHPGKELATSRSLNRPGYTQVICWKDIPDGGRLALLISNDSS